MFCPTGVFRHSNAFVRRHTVNIKCLSCGYLIDPDESFFKCPGCGTPEEEMEYYDEAYLIPEKELCFE